MSNHPAVADSRLGRPQALVTAIAVLASFVSLLDGTIVNVALPKMTSEMGGGLEAQQWIAAGYLVTLGSFILVAGAVSDRYGHKRIMRVGLIGFGIMSLAVAISPTVEFLVAARALQGVAGALLVPSSLALITGRIHGPAQARAIGIWTAMTSVALLAGPVVGGLFVDFLNWRIAFAVNVAPLAVTLWLLTRLTRAGESRRAGRIDFTGAVLCTVGLGGIVFALIEQQELGWGHWLVITAATVGVAAFAGFLVRQRLTPEPIMPLRLFLSRNFGWGNIATTFVYAALGLLSFAFGVWLQEGPGLTATVAGVSTLPSTAVLIFGSSRVGAWAARFGPRLFMTIGPVIAGIGIVSMLIVREDFNYWWQMLPGVVIFGVGLTLTVSPLTSAVLGAIEPERTGIASAINNAVARVAGLVATALVGTITGGFLDLDGFHRVIVVMAVLLFLGGVVSWIGIRNPPSAAIAPLNVRASFTD